MSEQSTKEDLERARDAIIARIDALDAKASIGMEGWRQQQSAEHGALQHTQVTMLAVVRWIQDWCRKMFTHDKH